MNLAQLPPTRMRPRTAAHPADTAKPYHVHGAIITPTDFIPSGTVVLSGARISAVHPMPVPAAAGGLDVATDGIIAPGFIDAHNHASWAVLPAWRPSRPMTSRFDWRGKTRCDLVINPSADPDYAKLKVVYDGLVKDFNLTTEMIQFGQVRAVLGGTTTMVIDADIDPDNPEPKLDGFIRENGIPARVWGILDVTCVAARGRPDKYCSGPTLLERMLEELNRKKAQLLVHVGEGTDAFSRGEFKTLERVGLLTDRTTLIHAVSLLMDDWALVAKSGARLVWSPSSNVRLYGRSLDIGHVLGLGIPVALAPDWTLTGSSTVLDELAYVRLRYPWLDPQLLLEMVTTAPAAMLGATDLGRIEAGACADLVVIRAGSPPANRADAARRVIEARLDAVDLVFAEGAPIYAEEVIGAGLEQQVGPGEVLEFDYSGTPVRRKLWFESTTGASFAQLRNALGQAIKKIDKCKELAPLWEPS